jgi:glutathione S-transferase
MLPGTSRNMTFSFTGLPPSHPIGMRLETMAQKLVQLLEGRVAQSTWRAGEEFMAADLLSVFGVTTMRLFWPFGLEKCPAISAWLKRVGEREAYRIVSKFFLEVSLNFLGFVHYKDFSALGKDM